MAETSTSVEAPAERFMPFDAPAALRAPRALAAKARTRAKIARVRALTERRLSRLLTDPDEMTRRVAQSLIRSRRRELGANERAAVDEIETLRSKLAASGEQITATYYGSGSRTNGYRLTTEQMERGVDIDATVGSVCDGASKDRFWCSLLFRLVRDLSPRSCLELGTALGISAAYQASALELNGDGRLVTLEGAASMAAIAEANFESLGVRDRAEVVVGRFQDTLTDALETAGSVDFAFVDGQHDGTANLGYFDQILEAMSDTGVVVLDDIYWSADMHRAWQEMARDPRIVVGLDLGWLGVCVKGVRTGRPRIVPLAMHDRRSSV